MSHDDDAGGQGRAQVHAKGGTGTSDVEPRSTPQNEWKLIEAYAKEGTGSAKDLPKHIAGLGGWTEGPIELMPDIAKRASGDIVLECASLLRMPLAKQVSFARHAKEPVQPDVLREHLRNQSVAKLAELDDDADVIQELRTKVLKGALAVELPGLATVPSAIHTKPNLIQWYVETVAPSLAGLQITTAAGKSKDLVATLDTVAAKTPKAWGWLDAMRIESDMQVGSDLVGIRDSTTNDVARTKLTALTKRFEQNLGNQSADAQAAIPDFAAQLKTRDDNAFLDAAARTQHNATLDRTGVSIRLAGGPADTVAEYLATVDMSDPKQVREGIQLLHNAKGTRPEHVVIVLAPQQTRVVIAALTDDTTRKQLRTMVGRSTRLRSLFSRTDAEAAHPVVATDEALRHWAYEDARPENLLWIAAGSGEAAKTGCRLVRSEKGNGWVKELPFDADTLALRRFILNSGDSVAVKWVETNLLHDAKHATDADEDKVVATDRTVYGQGAEFRPEALGNTADPELVLARLADLSDRERAALIADPAHVRNILGEVPGRAARVVELLAPTLPQLLTFPIAGAVGLIDYTSTRPAVEQYTAARKADVMHAIVGDVSPFIALPALQAQPEMLAKALADNDALLAWIFASTDASQALTLLSRDPVRKAVARLMENGHAYTGLPQYEHLRKQGRQAFDSIEGELRDDDTKHEAKRYKHGHTPTDHDADDRAKATKHAVAVGNLAANLSDILDAGGSPGDVIAVIQAATPAQQIDLMSGNHEALVVRLRQRLRKIGPQHVFPAVSPAQLVTLPSALRWLIEGDVARTTALHLVSNDAAAQVAFAAGLTTNAASAASFADELPHGASLTALERHALDGIAQHLVGDDTTRAMFHARFDVTVETSYTAADTKQLWAVLQRLPAAQVDQNVVEGFTKKSLGGPVGQWGNPTIDLEENRAKLAGNDARYDREIELSADEVKRYYGLDDKGVETAVDAGWLVKLDNGKYVVKQTDPAQFTTTVIHEVGHSVDTLLGEHTDLVYGLAGWRRYGYDQFEEFASEMGVFDSVTATDRQQIVEVWQQALRSHVAVSKLVGKDHPAITNTSPLTPFIDDDHPFQWKNASLQPIRDRVFMQTPSTLASIKKQAWDNAPTDYSLTAPGEFFAECYVEYYVGYNGTKETEDKKGGALPTWIRSWFDSNVDNIRLSPHRVHEGLDDKKP